MMEGCDIAVRDFRREHAIAEEMHVISGGGAYWRRS